MSVEHLADGVWYDVGNKGYVMLDVGKYVPELTTIAIGGRFFLPKDEHHCSLVPARKYAQMATAEVSEAVECEAKIIGAIRTQLGRQAVTFTGFTGGYYLCERASEATIVGLVDLGGIDELRHVITDQTGVTIDYPKPHVTLYKTSNSPYGIGIRNEAEFAEKCRELPSDVVTMLRNVVVSPA